MGKGRMGHREGREGGLLTRSWPAAIAFDMAGDAQSVYVVAAASGRVTSTWVRSSESGQRACQRGQWALARKGVGVAELGLLRPRPAHT